MGLYRSYELSLVVLGLICGLILLAPVDLLAAAAVGTYLSGISYDLIWGSLAVVASLVILRKPNPVAHRHSHGVLSGFWGFMGIVLLTTGVSLSSAFLAAVLLTIAVLHAISFFYYRQYHDRILVDTSSGYLGEHSSSG